MLRTWLWCRRPSDLDSDTGVVAPHTRLRKLLATATADVHMVAITLRLNHRDGRPVPPLHVGHLVLLEAVMPAPGADVGSGADSRANAVMGPPTQPRAYVRGRRPRAFLRFSRS